MALYSNLGRHILGDNTKGYNQGQDTLKAWYEQASKKLQPYEEFGRGYMNNMAALMSKGRPTAETITQTPGYKFRFDQGKEALENSAIARGGALSGNAMKAITEYGQNFATNEYDKELDRDTNEFAKLMQLIGMGQSSAAGSANMAMDTGKGIAGLQVGAGEAELKNAMAMNQVFKDISDSMSKWFGGGKGGGGGMCWVADELYGEGSEKAKTVRKYAYDHVNDETEFGDFLREYQVHGMQWAALAKVDPVFKESIRPIWDDMYEKAVA